MATQRDVRASYAHFARALRHCGFADAENYPDLSVSRPGDGSARYELECRSALSHERYGAFACFLGNGAAAACAKLHAWADGIYWAYQNRKHMT